MPAPQKIIDLVERFTEQKDTYLKSGYNEAQVRQDFINPFFEALGWDMDNSSGAAEAYRDVIHEARVSANGSTKAPDYSFGIAGMRKFFVEAKKPSVDIASNIEAAFQIRRYGWSAKFPLSILTNFNEFAVYDTRTTPKQADPARKVRLFHYHYTDYIDEWDKIESLFSRQAVLSGALDRFNDRPRRGTEAIDDAFLAEIEQWRERLAKDIYKNNPRLSGRDLNSAVQLIIDRIIFLRICEDRGIEPEDKLQSISTQPNIYDSLKVLFTGADAKYNSGLFHFNEEEGQKSLPDTLTPRLKISDGILQGIFETLYYPFPYEFSVLPADILGHIYERFLGKVIRLTEKRVKIEEKPEVRKAKGVYYTPSHIVDYIIEYTVGNLLEGATPDKVSKLRILDPACGSGSFLIVAYQYLLDWHLDYYLQLKRPPKNTIVQDNRNTLRLSIAERKRILRNNIFGTDIDRQAVEVTKLSLLLKVLEGENETSIKQQLHLERVLPDLGSNIKSGNSLIGGDFYTRQADLDSLLDEEDHFRINAFDWEESKGFPQIMADGGFDAVIGNPPYISAISKGFKDYEKNYLYEKFKLENFQLNTYPMFIKLGLQLLKDKGKFGYIIPNKWLTIATLQSFRDYILSNTGNLHIVNYDYKVFDGVNMDTSTLIFEKTKPSFAKLFKASKEEKPKLAIKCNQNDFIGKKAIIIDKTFLEAAPIVKAMNQFKRLGDYAVVKAGLKAYETGTGQPKQTDLMKKNRIYHAHHQKDKSYRRFLKGKDVRRYKMDWTGQWLKYGKNLAAMRKESLFEGERILVRRIPSKKPYSICATITDDDYINDSDNMIVHIKCNYNIKVILGLLNSKLMSFWFNATYQKLQSEIFPQFKVRELAEFPMALDSPVADEIAEKVDKLINLLSKVGKNPNATMQAKIDQLNNTLDALAYQAYGLSDDDIDFVEKNSVTDKK